MVSAARRVARGATAYPKTNAVPTHWARQNGQVSSSPTACLTPPCSRTSSATSAWPDGPWNAVNGARIGLVTGSLASRRASRKVATVRRTASPRGIRLGRRREGGGGEEGGVAGGAPAGQPPPGPPPRGPPRRDEAGVDAHRTEVP